MKVSAIDICDKCDYKVTQQSNLLRHKQSKHEDVHYGCDQCNQHKQSKPEGVIYDCDQCDS